MLYDTVHIFPEEPFFHVGVGAKDSHMATAWRVMKLCEHCGLKMLGNNSKPRICPKLVLIKDAVLNGVDAGR